MAELEQEPFPGIDDVLADEFIDILREAVLARDGWKRILERCTMPPMRRSLMPGGAI